MSAAREPSGTIAQVVSCLDGYDPEALRVDKAGAAIRACLVPVTQIETVTVREALGRVLAQEIVPRINVPGHDNSAMDGYAVRFSDLKEKTALRQVGTAFAGKPFQGTVGAGECVRVMTGAVMPQGADTVVVQEVCRAEQDRISIPAGQKAGQNVRAAGEDLKAGVAVLHPGHPVRRADLGLIASRGIRDVKGMR